MEYTKDVAVPPLFRQWVGIGMVAMALERKVWHYTDVFQSNLYPNLYTILLAPPAIGKTVMTSNAADILDQLEDHFLAPSSVSRASLMDALQAAKRQPIINGVNLPEFNSLSIISNEFSVFLTEYSVDFVSTLTDLYDNKNYSEKKRGKQIDYKMKAVNLNLCASTTPAQLNDLLPDNAYEYGFMSRVIMVYSGEVIPINDYFLEIKQNKGLRQMLIDDLRIIGAKYGALTYTPEAKLAFNTWNIAGRPPVPTHPRLTGYNRRRASQLMKLSMIANMSSVSDFKLSIEDHGRAMGWLLQAESTMNDVFALMQSGGEIHIMRETWHFCWKYHLNNGRKGVREGMILEYIQSKGTPARDIEKLFMMMLKVGFFEKRLDMFIPREPPVGII